MRKIVLSALAVLALAGSPAAADDLAAYLALIRTPVAGLHPTAPELGEGSSPARWSLRYGRMSDPFFEEGESQHAAGAGVDWALGKGRMGLTLGYSLACGFDCEGGGLFMAGLSWNRTLWTSRPGGGGRFAVAFNPSLGFATSRSEGGTLLSAAGQVPLAAALDRRGNVVAYLAPGIGAGRISADGESYGGARPMLGGGISIGRRDGLRLSLGFQKVFVEGGAIQLGLGLSGAFR